LRSAHTPAEMSNYATRLAAEGPAAVPAVNALSADPLPELKITAIMILGRIGGEQAAESLLRLLSDASFEARMTAASQLGMIADERTISRLIPLSRTSFSDTAVAAMVALEKCPRSSAAAALREFAASHADREGRAQAIESLGRRRDRESVE